MKKFSSYGPVNKQVHYFVQRDKIIEDTYNQLTGDIKSEKGHYITVWAPRQTGKTWIMQQVMQRIRLNDTFEVAMIDMQPVNEINSDEKILQFFIKQLEKCLGRELPEINDWIYLTEIFEKKYFKHPFILIIDEFDSLKDTFINKFASLFRSLYISRMNESESDKNKNCCMLHGLALIGIRSVLGIENVSGSPFNVQRSVRIPNFSEDEVQQLFNIYEQESGQTIESLVISNINEEFKGQPGLTCWFAELITEKYNERPDKPISMSIFKKVYALALHTLPNNNIINIISKVKSSPYKEQVLELFKTEEKIPYSFNDPIFTYLYMIGVIDYDMKDNYAFFVRFQSPFIQKTLFSYFSREIFRQMGQLIDPFIDIDQIITKEHLDILAIIKLYEQYLKKNKHWLLKNAPRRDDMRIYEAVYHFNFYMYLCQLLRSDAHIFPEFPTGNGKVDIMIQYYKNIYAIEIKSFTNKRGYHDALIQAKQYAEQLGLLEITLLFFLEFIDDENRNKFEKTFVDKPTGIRVESVFVVC
ncbi:protein containing DUF1703 [Candidatus Magnetomorum sp. HK-1]|nr:protein containing DUF1703 [Candidatus Magnetomorum sp. HK-1]